MRMNANWSYPTSIRFGAGRLSELHDVCQAAGILNPLLVTDRGLAGHPITHQALDALRTDAIFSEVDPNPTGANLEAGLTRFREGAHDGVVAFGGGSGMDVGKLIAFMAGQVRSVWDFEDVDDYWTRADANEIRPVVAVPTTAGTGSEVGRASVLTNEESLEKKIIFHPRMLPETVIADPDLTIGLPPAMTAGTGMDAFAHSLEAFSSPHFHPMSQGIALEAMRLVLEHLPRVYRDPGDIVSRGQMMAASMMGAVAFQKGLGAIHAISHPIGAVHKTHHGTTNAVVMDAVLGLNAPAIAERIEAAMGYLGLTGGFDAFRAHIGALNGLLGIPGSLTELGVQSPDLDLLTDMALRDPSVGGNPIKMTRDNTRALIEACL
ncbi:MAG: iron-containing alcohol dehydrogenase [Paracoccaceae bacterium]